MIRFEGLRGGRFLDWAGGYGVFAQIMRDRGFDYWHHDDFAPPIFAGAFRDAGHGGCDLVSAFEVLEHLEDPRHELAQLARRTNLLVVTTALLPKPAPAPSQWWYYTPTIGQHVTFYTVESLRALGEQLGYQLVSNGVDLHLFHREPIDLRTRALLSPILVRAGRSAKRMRGKVRRS